MPPISYLFWALFFALVFFGGWGGYSWPAGRRWFVPSYLILLILIFLLGYEVYK